MSENVVTIPGNIITFDVDVIVNSLGIGEGVVEYGGICKSILNAVNSTELKEKIDNAKDIYYLGDYFVTPSYGLPCKKILNIVTPYYENDPDLLIYKDCIRRILYECKLRDFHSIAIPLIGAGANGYKERKQDLYVIIRELSEAFSQIYDLKVTIVASTDDISKANRERIEHYYAQRGTRERAEIKTDVVRDSNKYLGMYDWDGTAYDMEYFSRGPVDYNDAPILNVEADESVMKYVEKFIEQRYPAPDSNSAAKFAHARVRGYLGYGNSEPKTAGSKLLSKMTWQYDINSFYKIIFALRMSMEEAQAFLSFYGRGFPSPSIDEKVDIIKSLINNRIYDLYEINDELISNHSDKLF